jgi:hypothetical protein
VEDLVAVITGAGRAGAGPAKPPVSPRKAIVKELARRLRAAKDDDEYAEALEAALELATTEE